MDYGVSGIDDFTGRCDRQIGIDFKSLVHSLAHNLNITLNAPTEQQIFAERLIFFRTVLQKVFDFIYRIKNILQIFTKFSIHI